MKYALVVLVTVVVIALGVLLFPYTGFYNVAASTGHTDFARWYLNTTAMQSIKARADDITIPVDLTDSLLVARGAAGFAAMCQVCHGAPGKDRGVIGQGMTPQPPRLSEAAAEWSPEEVYWILEHGIKMAGMPAFGPTHGEKELWEIAAFVEQLPEMTPERYEALTARPETASADSAAAGAASDGHDHVH